MKLQCFSEHKISLREKEGWRSVAYRKRVPRTAVAFDVEKKDSKPIRYITVITPSKSNTAYPDIKAKFVNKAFNENGVKVKVTVDGKTKVLESNIK